MNKFLVSVSLAGTKLAASQVYVVNAYSVGDAKSLVRERMAQRGRDWTAMAAWRAA